MFLGIGNIVALCASSSASYLPLLHTKRLTRSGGRSWRYLRFCGGTLERHGVGFSKRVRKEEDLTKQLSGVLCRRPKGQG